MADERIDDFIDDWALGERHTMRVLTRWAELLRADLPPIGVEALEAANQRWLHGRSTPRLKSFRVACWQYLDAKNGASTVIADSEDRAVRVLIGCLYDELDDLDMALRFVTELLIDSGLTERYLIDVANTTP